MHTRRISPEDHIEQYYWVACTNQFNTKAASHLYFNKYFMFSLWIVLAFIICSGTRWLEVKWIVKLIKEQLRTWRSNRALKKSGKHIPKCTNWRHCIQFAQSLQMETAQGTRRTYWVGSMNSTGRSPCGYISMACKYVDMKSFLNWSFIFLWSHADTATSKEENSLSTLFLWYKDFRVIFWYKDISDDSEFWQRKPHVASLTVRNVDKIDCLADWTSYHIGKSYTA